MGTTLPVLRGLCSEILDLLKTWLRSPLTPAGLSLRAAAETHFQEWGFEANQPRTWGSAGTPTTLPTQKLRVEEIANGRSPPALPVPFPTSGCHIEVVLLEDNPHPTGKQDFWQDFKRAPADNHESWHHQEPR